MRGRSPRRLGAIAAVGLLAAVTASCAGSHESKSANLSAPLVGAQGGAGSNSAIGAAGKATAAGASSGPEVDLAAAKRPGGSRQVISTAALEVQARDIDQTVQRATAVVAGAEGYVFSETASLTKPEHAHVVFKVDPSHFDEAVAGIGRLGTLVHREIGTQDVTGQVVDLNARLAAAQTSADRLRQLLATSGGVGDLLSVEQQLTARDAQVDSLSGELAALRAQVDLATITLDIGPPTGHAAPATHHPGTGFRRGLHAGTGAFAHTARVVEAGVGIVLPFLPFALLFLAGWWLVRRRAAATAPTS